MSRNVMVCGGAGFIGAQVCKTLARRGYTPVAYDTLEKGHDWAVQWGPLVRADIGDRAALDDAFSRYRPEAVINLAGYIEVGESMREPERYRHNNVEKTAVLLDAVRRHGAPPFAFSSTCAVYGPPQREPLDETHPVNPISVYGETKLSVERMLVEAQKAWGLRWLALRYFNAAGADPDGDIGEAHEPETHLMPLAIDAALGLGAPLVVFGDDYPTRDGTCVRDFVHVLDIAEAHVSAIGALAGGLDSQAVNLGSGRGYSVRELLDATEKAAGSPVPHSAGARRPGDPPRLVGECSRALRTLGWRATRDLDAQIADALRWRRKMRR